MRGVGIAKVGRKVRIVGVHGLVVGLATRCGCFADGMHGAV